MEDAHQLAKRCLSFTSIDADAGQPEGTEQHGATRSHHERGADQRADVVQHRGRDAHDGTEDAGDGRPHRCVDDVILPFGARAGPDEEERCGYGAGVGGIR